MDRAEQTAREYHESECGPGSWEKMPKPKRDRIVAELRKMLLERGITRQ